MQGKKKKKTKGPFGQGIENWEDRKWQDGKVG